MTQSEFCTDQTLQANASIIGTASADTSVWFFLEVPKPWAAKALATNDLLPQVNETIEKWVYDTPKSRAVFIKKDNRPVESPKLYIAITEDHDQRLHQFELSKDYTTIADVPIEAVIADTHHASRVTDPSPLYLVCTNGKRDNCCSKFGLPIIKAFEDTGDKNTWQCTHLGGHKFSAVVGVFPHGLYYQIYNPVKVAPFKQAIEQNKVVASGLRGRTAYSGVAQAAEYFLRQHTADWQMGSYTLEATADAGENQQVTFKNGSGRYTVTVQKGLSDPVISGCNGKLKPSPTYTLVSITN